MRAFELRHAALSITLTGALLSACGGASSVPVAADNAFKAATGPKHHQTFSYTGKKQTFIVPAGVRRLTVVARGAEGEQGVVRDCARGFGGGGTGGDNAQHQSGL